MCSKKSKYYFFNKNNELCMSEREIHTELKKKDVLVKIIACGISVPAKINRTIFNEIETELNHKTLGTDVLGIIEDVGAEVNNVHTGDHVAGIIPLSYGQSGCGQFVVLEEYDISTVFVRIPDHANPMDIAACIGDSFRSYIALYYCSKITKDDIILILNGAMPTANICIQVAHLIGAKILTTCWSSTEKAYLETFNDCIDEIIDLSSDKDIAETLYEECMKRTDNLGVDIILDLETSEPISLETIISCLTIHGRWVTCNNKLQLDPPQSKLLFDRCASISFMFEQAWLISKIAQGKYQHILFDIVNKLKENIIRPCAYQIIDFQSLPDIMQQLRKQNVNKIVVSIE